MRRIQRAFLSVIVMLCAPSVYAGQSYVARDQMLNIAAEIPSGWVINESRGNSGAYAQLIASMPESQRGLRAGIVLTAQSAETVQGKQTLDECLNELVSSRKALSGFQLIVQSSGMFLEEESRVLECSYQVPDKIHGRDINLIAVKERIVVVIKKDIVYTARYVNTQEDFNAVFPLFENFLQSVQLRPGS
jgi:hypothetical protein